MSKKGKNTGDVYSSEFKDDCEDFIPIPDTLGKRKRIIAIGDVHGDLNLTINYLLISKVIKKTKDTKEILKVTYEDGTEENGEEEDPSKIENSMSSSRKRKSSSDDGADDDKVASSCNSCEEDEDEVKDDEDEDGE